MSNDAPMEVPFPGRKLTSPYRLSPRQIRWFREWFPKTENLRVANAMGVSVTTMHLFARAMGLTKSEEGLKGIMKRQAETCKMVCESNGEYERRRGKAPSQKCLDAAREWRKNNPHPFVLMREKDPEKYEEFITKMSEDRKALWRKERRRKLYGMQQETKLLIRVNPYTDTQRNHRYNALRRGYFLSTDTSEEGGERFIIYYDDNTDRAEKFEKNCIKDGFKFVYEQ